MAPPAIPAQKGGSAVSRLFSKHTTDNQKTYVDVDHEHMPALLSLRARIAEAGMQIPRELVVNGDVDATLYRFLRARKYDVHLAFAMLEKSLAWRAQVGADTILEQPVDAHFTSVVRQCRPSSYIGHDQEHHPIFIERLGQLDGKRMEREGATDDVILAYHLREMEFMSQVVLPEASAAAGRTQDRTVTVMDAAGLSLSSLTGFAQRLFRVITAMDSDNYPECCHAIYIANAGAAFSAIWKLLAAFVDRGTRDKVHVLGGTKASKAALLDAFGPDLVPTFLGGQLNYEAVRQQWLDKMDAAIAQRQQHPCGKQVRRSWCWSKHSQAAATLTCCAAGCGGHADSWHALATHNQVHP
ncbi:CRAL-TRIO domain-containing protein [Scenedesmus sp. NREL 46B-D3]|nr:CRAL-TRIO domain-containing protein [Scenedesmus sp. NREL 46B-D3]